jgi:hypothetical protein
MPGLLRKKGTGTACVEKISWVSPDAFDSRIRYLNGNTGWVDAAEKDSPEGSKFIP